MEVNRSADENKDTNLLKHHLPSLPHTESECRMGWEGFSGKASVKYGL